MAGIQLTLHRLSMSHCPAVCPDLRRGGIFLAFDTPPDGVETACAPADGRCAGNPANFPAIV